MPNPFAQAALAELTEDQRQHLREAAQKRLDGFKAFEGMQGATGVQAALFRAFSPTLNDNITQLEAVLQEIDAFKP
jgi:hypothetical protein